MPSESIGPSDIFSCKKCGDCCIGFGGTFVSPQDIRDIADFLGMDSARFINDYCQASGNRWVIATAENGYCVFWDQICMIHPVKPKMCKAWPFIESVLIDASNWQIMAGLCPGIRTDFQDHIVQSCVRQALKSGLRSSKSDLNIRNGTRNDRNI